MEQALAEGFAAARIVEEFESEKPYKVGDTTYMPCPEQVGTKPNCLACKLCMNDKKLHKGRCVITFRAHGSRRKTVLRVLSEAEIEAKLRSDAEEELRAALATAG